MTERTLVYYFIGTRLEGVTGRDHNMDSIKSMHVRSWLKERLPNWSDHDPTSERIEIEKMSHDDLYYVFVMDMLDLESLPLADVPLMPLFLRIWKKEFPNIVIRELKTVDSKDKAHLPNFLVYLSSSNTTNCNFHFPVVGSGQHAPTHAARRLRHLEGTTLPSISAF